MVTGKEKREAAKQTMLEGNGQKDKRVGNLLVP